MRNGEEKRRSVLGQDADVNEKKIGPDGDESKVLVTDVTFVSRVLNYVVSSYSGVNGLRRPFVP